jgi:CRISPR/Cas system-associated exonuclease Cas4 (RecB family)
MFRINFFLVFEPPKILITQKAEIENSFNSKVDELAMEIDLDKSMNTEKNQKEVQKVEKLKDETEEGVRIYKDFILGNDETFNIPSNLSSDEYKKLIEKIEEIEKMALGGTTTESSKSSPCQKQRDK